MITQKIKKVCALALVGILATVTALSGMPGEGRAAKKTRLKSKNISVAVGSKKKIQIQGRQKKHTYTFVSKNKKIAKVSAKGVVTGVRQGKTKIVVKDDYKLKKKKKSKVLGNVTVKVTKANKSADQAGTVTNTPNTPGAGTQTQAPAPTVLPTQTAAVTQTPTQAPSQTQTPEDILDLWPDEDWDPSSTKEPETPARYHVAVDDVTYGEMREITYPSTTTGVNRKANVLLPPDYNEDVKYPVMYLLHGLDGDHNEWKNNGSPAQIIGNLITYGEAREMIVVMPNARARENDKGSPSDSHSVPHFQAFDNFKNDLLNDLMPYIKENFSIAEGRENTAVAGLSMGGRTALYIGISEPQMFGYVGAFSPAIGVLPYDVEPEGLFKPEEFKLPDLYNGKNFVMICTANVDSVVHETPVEYAQKLIENGTKIMFFMRNGGDHGWDTWRDGLYHFAKRIFTQI